MHPPEASCRRLYEFHPWLRLAWLGRERQHKDDLNAGTFALVQLYHISDAGTPEMPRSFREMWDVDLVMDDWGRTELKRANRGPIFSRHGTTERDWDPLFRVPILVAGFEDMEPAIPRHEIFSGSFIRHVEAWAGSYVKRYMDSAKQKARDLRTQIDDMSDSATDRLWYEANKTDATYVIPDNDSPAETRRMKQKREGKLDIEANMLPKPPKWYKE